jgi:hypothetical protein
MLVPSPSDWPSLSLAAALVDPPPRRDRLTGDHADLTLNTGGRLTVDRRRGVATFSVPRPLSPHELVHPYLAPAAAVMSYWLRRTAFHAGAFVSGGGAWALAGDREAGKSSTLAALALRGHDVVADDVVIVAARTVFAGPRSIDLREETAKRFGVGEALGVVGTRPRWRVALPPAEPEFRFRGWFFLSWADEVEVRRLSVSECLSRLIQHCTIRMTPSDPASLLDFAALPAWEVGRPRDWSALDDALDVLLDVTMAAA